MAIPTWDQTTLTWDLPNLKWDAPYIDPSVFTAEPRRTYRVIGEDIPQSPQFVKDPDAKLDYTWDFSDYLSETGDALQTGSFVFPSAVTVAAISISADSATAWVSGGRGVPAGTAVPITLRFHTTQGRDDDRTLLLKIKDR